MASKKIRDYFLKQIRLLIERSASEPGGFADYFARREPRDEEILCYIAVTTLLTGKYHLTEHFPTPAEALAALPAGARTEICRKFREQLRDCQRQLSIV
jgi:hypothetical protein